MRYAIPAVLALALIPAASSLAQTDAPPTRKPGWWEMRMLISGPTPQAIEQIVHVCTDPSVDKRQSPFGVSMNGPGCPAPTVTRMADRWTVSGACNTGAMKITADAVATGSLDDRYHVDIDTHLDPPPAPNAAEVKIGIDARWLGECPAGKAPGDVEIGANAAK
jgi:hypothetical protein